MKFKYLADEFRSCLHACLSGAGLREYDRMYLHLFQVSSLEHSTFTSLFDSLKI